MEPITPRNPNSASNNPGTPSGSDATDAPDRQFRYPEGMKVYAMVIDDRVPSALIRVGLHALRLVRVDRLVLLCLASDDIRNRVDWDELTGNIASALGRQDAWEVRLVNSHEELMYASLHMHIVHLPASNAVHPLPAFGVPA